MAIRFFAVFSVVVLMISFGIPKSAKRIQFSFDLITFLPKYIQQFPGGLALSIVKVKNRRTVLGSEIRPLPVMLCRIMNFQKIAAKFLKSGQFRAIKNFNRLR